MKYIKKYKLFESGLKHIFDDAINIIEDHKFDFIDLGFDISSPVIGEHTYHVLDDGSPDGTHYVDTSDEIIIDCLSFEISTQSESVEIISECYEALSNLRSHLESELGLDLSLLMYDDIPLMGLEEASEVYGSLDWEALSIYIHKPFEYDTL